MTHASTQEAVDYVREYRVLKLIGGTVFGLVVAPFGWSLLYSSNPQYDLIAFVAGVVLTGGGLFLAIGAGVALLYQVLSDTVARQ